MRYVSVKLMNTLGGPSLDHSWSKSGLTHETRLLACWSSTGRQNKFNFLENMPLKPEQRQAAYDKWSPVLGEIFDDLDKDKSGFASVDEMWYVWN